MQFVADGLHARYASRHGERFLNLYLRIHIPRQLHDAAIRRDAHRQDFQFRVRDERGFHTSGKRSVVGDDLAGPVRVR